MGRRLCSNGVVGECCDDVVVERACERQLEHHHHSGKEAVDEAEDLVDLARLVVDEAEHLEEGEGGGWMELGECFGDAAAERQGVLQRGVTAGVARCSERRWVVACMQLSKTAALVQKLDT